MLNRWLENEPEETLICAVSIIVSLVINLSAVVLSALGDLNPITARCGTTAAPCSWWSTPRCCG